MSNCRRTAIAVLCLRLALLMAAVWLPFGGSDYLRGLCMGVGVGGLCLAITLW